MLIPNFKDYQYNAIEKYTCSSNCLPKYEAATPLVKLLEGRSGSFCFKQSDAFLETIVDNEMSATSTQYNSVASSKQCHNTIDSNFIDASEENSLAVSP